MTTYVPDWLGFALGDLKFETEGIEARARIVAREVGEPGLENAIIQGYRAAEWLMRRRAEEQDPQ